MRRLPIVVAGVVAILAGCGGSHAPTEMPTLDYPDAAPPRPDGMPVPTPDAAPTGPASFDVKSPPNQVVRLTKGKGKAEALRYAFTSPGGEVVDSTVDVAMDVMTGDKPQHEIAPTQNVGRSVEITGVDENGTAMVKTTLERGSAADADMTETLEQLKGTTIAASVDARGRQGDATVTSPALDATSAASIAGLIRFHADPIVLPEEPVAVGGTWQVVTHGPVNNIDTEITTTYKLVERTATAWKVTGTIQATAEAQTIPSEALGGAGGGTIEVRAMTGKGTMSATIDPAHPVPTAEFKESYDATLAVNGHDIHLLDTITVSVTTRAR